jgi:hypothetical protein
MVCCSGQATESAQFAGQLDALFAESTIPPDVKFEVVQYPVCPVYCVA